MSDTSETITPTSDVLSWTEIAQSLSQPEVTEPKGEKLNGVLNENFESSEAVPLNTGTAPVDTTDAHQSNLVQDADWADLTDSRLGSQLDSNAFPFVESNVTRTSPYLVTESVLTSQERNIDVDAKPVRKRVFRVVRQKRRKLKRQSSLVDLTLQWLVVNTTGLFGEQLDRRGLYLLALIVFIACAALFFEVSPFVLIVLVGLCTIAFCVSDFVK